MSTLPKGWASSKLGDLHSVDGFITDGDWIESKDQDPDGENRLLQLADIGDGLFVDKSSRFVNNEKFSALNCTAINEGDVLIARMPDPLGRACLAPKMPLRCLTVVDVAIFRAGIAGVLNKWLVNWINSPVIRAYIDVNASGTTRKRISKGNLIAMELPVPPLPEQKRIANKLNATLARVDACRSRLGRVTPILKRFRHSVLAAATSGQLTADWREQQGFSIVGNSNKEPRSKAIVDWASQAQPNLRTAELPPNWKMIALGDVILDLRYGTSKKCDYSNIGQIVLRIPNMADKWKLDLTDVKRAEFTPADTAKLKLKKGDLLLIRSNGSIDLVGKTCLVTEQEEGLLFAGYLMRMKVESKVVFPKYICLSMSGPALRTAIEATCKSTSGVNNINSDEVKGLPITLPPKCEQAEIVRRVETLFAFADRLEARLASTTAAAERLTPSLLAKAFRGELVPQDPNDEPASELLKRLAAQREAGLKAKGTKKSATSAN